MDENAWAGATANVYVLKYVLEKNLGCKVNIEKLPESTPLFQAMFILQNAGELALCRRCEPVIAAGKVVQLGISESERRHAQG